MAGHKLPIPLLLLLLSPLTLLADPVVNTRSVYYEIDGGNAASLWADVRNKTPVEQNGRWHVAYTKWHVNWRFWWQQNADNCEITRVATTLDVVYTLPKLIQNDTRPDELSLQWEIYYSALYEHEQGHKNIGLKAALEIEDVIAAMTPTPSCAELEKRANEKARDVINKYSSIEKNYDRTTNHGRNTGVVFPLTSASK